MIYYFSATGNSEFIAKLIAEKTNDTAYSVQEKNLPMPIDGGKLGIIFPIHAWGIPRPILDLIAKLKDAAFSYVYSVCTCGEDAGKCMKKLSKLLPLDAAWSVVMPNNYIISYDLDDERGAEKKITDARTSVAKIVKSISTSEKAWDVHEGKFPWVKTNIINKAFASGVKYANEFHSDGCTSCGICAELCPTENITYDADGKPVWHKKCIQCLACLHRCPAQAIQFGKSTQEKGRYTLESFLDKHNC